MKNATRDREKRGGLNTGGYWEVVWLSPELASIELYFVYVLLESRHLLCLDS